MIFHRRQGAFVHTRRFVRVSRLVQGAIAGGCAEEVPVQVRGSRVFRAGGVARFLPPIGEIKSRPYNISSVRYVNKKSRRWGAPDLGERDR